MSILSKSVRSIAVDIIFNVRYEGGYINKSLQEISLTETTDMSLLTNLVYGTIKNYEYLEAYINEYTELNKSKRIVRVIVVLAAYQLLFLDKIPEYAIIDQAVSEAKKRSNDFAGNFVNSLLRKIVQGIKDGKDLNLEGKENYQRIAIEESMPEWIVRLMISQYGEQETASFLNEAKSPSRQFARVNRLKTAKSEILLEPGFLDTSLPDGVEYLEGNIASHPLFKEGKISVQNISSQEIGEALAPRPGERIWDMCAAPGGKTAHIAEIMGDEGEVIATDLYPLRVNQITENIERLGIKSVKAQVQDVLQADKMGMFDRILLDAPCSGFGVLRQKPEIKYQIEPNDLDELSMIQREMLKVAYGHLKQGGTLVYSTCTINRKENEKQIEWFLSQFEDMKLERQKTIFSEVVDGHSGFYYAILLKEEKN